MFKKIQTWLSLHLCVAIFIGMCIGALFFSGGIFLKTYKSSHPTLKETCEEIKNIGYNGLNGDISYQDAAKSLYFLKVGGNPAQDENAIFSDKFGLYTLFYQLSNYIDNDTWPKEYIDSETDRARNEILDILNEIDEY